MSRRTILMVASDFRERPWSSRISLGWGVGLVDQTREWRPPWQRVAVREFPPSRARPPGRLTATASEPYVSACARVCWTRAARGCALSPLASALVRAPPHTVHTRYRSHFYTAVDENARRGFLKVRLEKRRPLHAKIQVVVVVAEAPGGAFLISRKVDALPQGFVIKGPRARSENKNT